MNRGVFSLEMALSSVKPTHTKNMDLSEKLVKKSVFHNNCDHFGHFMLEEDEWGLVGVGEKMGGVGGERRGEDRGGERRGEDRGRGRRGEDRGGGMEGGREGGREGGEDRKSTRLNSSHL